jgi:Arc/MetJ family transcription regulator
MIRFGANSERLDPALVPTSESQGPNAYRIIGCMKKTLHIDGQLLREAKSAAGTKTDTDTVRLGLEALIRRAAYERVRALRGSEPRARDVRRRRGRSSSAAALNCMSVLVDTSVWIRSLSNRAPYASRSRDEVTGHDFRLRELLVNCGRLTRRWRPSRESWGSVTNSELQAVAGLVDRGEVSVRLTVQAAGRQSCR